MIPNYNILHNYFFFRKSTKNTAAENPQQQKEKDTKTPKNGNLSSLPSNDSNKKDVVIIEDDVDPLSIPRMRPREISDDESTLDAFDLDGQEIEPPIKKPKTIVTASTQVVGKFKSVIEVEKSPEIEATEDSVSSKVILKMRKGNDYINLPIVLDPSKSKQLVVIKHISEKWLNPEKVNMVPLDRKSTMFKQPLKVTIIDKERAQEISNEIKARKAQVAADHDYSFEEETEIEVRKSLGIPIDKKFVETMAHLNVYQDPPLKCFICNLTQDTEKSLIKHFMRHKTKIPYRCDLCRCNFRTVYDLHEHMKSHNKDRPFKCLDCNKYFLSKNNLTSHVIVYHKRSTSKELDVEK